MEKGSKSNTLKSLIKFIEDPNRTEPLVGLQYVVEIKVLGTNESILRCNICHLNGHVKTMMDHLIGLHHINIYMEMNYFMELQSIKHSDNKIKIPTLIKEFAREIERAEGTQNLQIEYISATDMRREPDNWIIENGGNSMFFDQQTEGPILDRRQMALNYSETLKISSRAEASSVLQLTQQLSDSLEQYFLNCKGLQVLDSGVPESKSEIYEASTKILPSSDYRNQKLGFQSIVENKHLDTEPTLSPCKATTNPSVGDPCEKIEDTSEGKHISGIISSRQDALLKEQNCFGLQSTKLQGAEDPFVFSQSISNSCEEPLQAFPVKVFLSQSSATSHYYSSVAESKVFVTQAHEPFHVKQNSEHSPCVPQVSWNSGKVVQVNCESKSPVLSNELQLHEQSDLGMQNNKSGFDTSPFNSTSILQSQAQDKTSKTLSPDILQLLKGKDANTVTNILKTLAPFYPALQDVNLEILAEVLVNTGALE